MAFTTGQPVRTSKTCKAIKSYSFKFFLIFKIEIFTSPLCDRQHFYNNQQITANDYFSLSSPSSSSSLPDATHEWEELLTSTGDRRAQFVLSPPSHGCPYSRREPLLSWVLDYAKRRKHSRNLSNICHSAKSEIGSSLRRGSAVSFS